MKLLKIFITSILINLSIFLSLSFSEIVKKIEISGNDRISEKTILIFSEIEIGDEIEITDTNILLKNLYDTNFFKDISLNYVDQVLTINVIENPIIENISYEGIKNKKTLEIINQNTFVKSRT